MPPWDLVHIPSAHCGGLTRCRNSVRSFFLFRHRAAATLFFSRRLFLRSSSSSSCEGTEPQVRHRGRLRQGCPVPHPTHTQTDAPLPLLKPHLHAATGELQGSQWLLLVDGSWEKAGLSRAASPAAPAAQPKSSRHTFPGQRFPGTSYAEGWGCTHRFCLSFPSTLL